MPETTTPKTRVIGRYSILRELRRERHSVSYAAVDPVMNRQLVVKAVELLPAGPKLSAEERKRVEQAFVRQAQAAGRLQHPHIVTVFDAGLSHAFGFLVIERVNGRPLHELLAGGLRPAFVQCASIAARIADALECAHKNGVAHGHLGPQHVYLQSDGSPKISGFGGWIDDGASGDEALAGTARLLPYFQNEINEETRQRDVRAIAQLLYMMLTGRAPPAQPTAAADGADTPASVVLQARPDTPPALARIVDQGLAMGLGSGPKTAGAMRDALTAFIWNERTDNVPPNSLGIPLAAPPPRAPVHVATITPAQGVVALEAGGEAPPLATVAPAAAPEEPAAPAPPAPPPDAAQAPAAEPARNPAWHAVLQELRPLLERLRPWATRNRLPLVSGGALLSIAIFIGVLLGNLRHPETAAAPLNATAPEAAPVAAAPAADLAAPPMVSVGLDIRPWGELFIDGKAIGVAPPLTQVELSAGRHHVEIRHHDAPTWETDMDVLPAGHAMIVHRFDQ